MPTTPIATAPEQLYAQIRQLLQTLSGLPNFARSECTIDVDT